MKVLVTVPEGIFRNKFFNEENKKILEDNFDSMVKWIDLHSIYLYDNELDCKSISEK